MKRLLVIGESLEELVRHLSPQLKRKVRYCLEEILENPDSGKELKQELLGLRSFKLGKLRIIYRKHPSAVEIITLGPRSTIYEKVALEIKHKKR